MKKVLLFVGMLSVMASCGPNYKAEVDILREDQDSLRLLLANSNEEVQKLLSDIAYIQSSISELTEQEQLIRNNSQENLNQDARERMLADLDAIRNTIKSNKNKLASIQSKLKKANIKITDLENTIASMNEQLAIRDSSIALLGVTIEQLTNRVNAAETEIAVVKSDNEVKAKEIADKTTKLNTAYYAIGTYKFLREKKVISNEGKIFKSKDVDPNFDTNAFTKIDVTGTKVIALNYVKDFKLATIHPTDSYTMIKENDRIRGIEVTNPERFWASSKYLVVVTE